MSTEAVLQSISPEFKEKIEKVISEVEAAGYRILLTSGRRTMKEQAGLYAKGRTEPGKKVTNAGPGDSPHNFGLAVDFCPFKTDGKTLDWEDNSPVWTIVGKIAEKYGLVWGGHFHSIVDKPHIEDKNWRLVQTAWKRGEVTLA